MAEYVPPLRRHPLPARAPRRPRRADQARALRPRRRRHRVRRARGVRPAHDRGVVAHQRGRRRARAPRSTATTVVTARPASRRPTAPTPRPAGPAVPFDADYGGGGFPWVVGIAMQEMLNSANMALAMAPLLTQGAIDALAPPRHRGAARGLPRADGVGGVDRHHEPHRARRRLRRRRAAHQGRQARTTAATASPARRSSSPSASTTSPTTSSTSSWPAPRTRRPAPRASRCFIVPKFLVDDDGSLGERNDVKVVSIEHKMGIKASPTCVLAYGDDGDGAVGYLIGEENAGMRYMFTMMNNARLGVGVEGLGLAERAYQQAVELRPGAQAGPRARARPGRAVAHRRPPRRAPHAAHDAGATPRRCGRSPTSGRRADRPWPRTSPTRPTAPRPTSWSTCSPRWPRAAAPTVAETVTSIGIQVHGGMGYIEETGVAQYYRDAKITQIYEGTNGIQAMDLVGRKLPMRQGGVVADLVGRHAGHRRRAGRRPATSSADPRRARGRRSTRSTTANAWIFEHGLGRSRRRRCRSPRPTSASSPPWWPAGSWPASALAASACSATDGDDVPRRRSW